MARGRRQGVAEDRCRYHERAATGSKVGFPTLAPARLVKLELKTRGTYPIAGTRHAVKPGMCPDQTEAVLARIRAEIQRHGQSIIGCDQLLVFVLRNAPIRSQFAHIFAMAEKQGWSLEFQPDGMVRFAALSSAAGKSGAWEERNRDIVQRREELRAKAL